MSDFKVIETQEEFNAIIGERLANKEKTVRQEYEKKYSDYESLKESNKSYEEKIAELTKANEEHNSIVEGLNKKIKQYETDSLKVQIALENGIPYQMASRLNGVDEESIRQDASTLSSFVNSKTTPPKRNPEAKSTSEDEYSRLLKGLKRE